MKASIVSLMTTILLIKSKNCEQTLHHIRNNENEDNGDETNSDYNNLVEEGI